MEQFVPKEAEIENIRFDVDKMEDALGMEIDPGVKDTIVYLKALGLNTTQSCEGHMDHGYPWPWVEISAPNEPEEIWEGQESEFARVAEGKNLDLALLKRAQPEKDYYEILSRVSDNPETAEHQAWRAKTHEMVLKIESLLTEFYKDRDVDDEVRLKIEEESLYGTRLTSFNQVNGENTDEYTDPNSEKRKGQVELLEKRRAELGDFTEFLKQKFYEK